MAYNKVFFHGAGPGIGDLIKSVHEAGIPFTVKSIKNEGWIAEAVQYARGSNIPHTIIYRDPNPNGANDDHPDLGLPPAQAAGEHWARVKAALPAAVKDNRDIVWVEPTNEIDTNAHAEWLGIFSAELAKLMLAEDYRVLLSGHNAGQPEPEHWELYFREFLTLCDSYPLRCGVSLHEGKLGDMAIPAWSDTWVPYLIGRYQFLHEACDRMGLARPAVVISEWAWAYNDLPDSVTVKNDISWLSAELAKHANILGLCLWNLDPGWGGATSKLPQYIGWVKELTLSTTYPDPEPPPDDRVLDWVDRLPKHNTKKYASREWVEIDKLVIHHTVTPSGIEWVKKIAEYHVNGRDWPGIGYHFCVAEDGTIVQANELATISYHAGSENRSSLGVALLGDFTESEPTDAQLGAARWLLEELVDLLPGTVQILPHRQVPNTATSCPGGTWESWFPRLLPPVISFPEFLWEQSLTTQTISLNPDAALQAAVFQAGFIPVGTESWTIYGNDSYAFMPAETLDGSKPRRVYYAKVPEWNNVQYILEPEETIPELPPTPERYDMANYFLPEQGDFGPIITLKNNWGAGNERVQLQRSGNRSYLTKNSQWEMREITNSRINLRLDTSPGEGKFYEFTGEWMPRAWGPGEYFTGHGTITFKNKSDCAVTDSYDSGSTLEFARHYDTFEINGFSLKDVVVVHWIVGGLVDETFWYAAGVGLVAWQKYDGRRSEIVEYIPVGTQENNVREAVPCIGG